MSQIEASIALIHWEGHWFLQRRDPKASVFPGLWEFPGGKLEPNETPISALFRELWEELTWKPEEWQALPALEHARSSRRIVLHPFVCSGSQKLGTPLAWGWFSLKEVRRLPIPPANDLLLDFMEERPW